MEQLPTDFTDKQIYDIIYKAVLKLVKNVDCQLTIKEIKPRINPVMEDWAVILVDEDIRQRMEEKKQQGWHFLDYVPEFKVKIASQFFIANVLFQYDKAVGITKNMSKETKAVLRTAFRILTMWKKWRDKVLYDHQELR